VIRVLTVGELSSNMKEQSGICGSLNYFCLSNVISFRNTMLNDVRVVSYVQTNERKDGKAEQFLIPKTERKSVILSLESQMPYTGTNLPLASVLERLNCP
jgi:hypothetical protein